MPAARRLFAVLPTLLAAGLACASAPPHEQGSADASVRVEAEPNNRATPDAGVTILVEPGAEPRAELRYHPRVGDRVAWSSTMVMTTTAEMFGQTNHTEFSMEMDCVTEVVAVDEAKAEHEYRSIILDARPLSQTVDPAALEAAVAPFINLESRILATPQGVPIEFRYFRDGAPVDASTIKGLDAVTAVLTFPTEPIGIGGRWRSYDEVERNGFRILQASEHRLVRRDGDELELETVVTQQPLSNSMRTPDMPPDSRVELRRWESTGTGGSTHRLDIAVPVRGRMDVDATLDAVIYAGDEQTEMRLKLVIVTTLARRE